MGRIKKAATERHKLTLSSAIADFVQEAVILPLHELPKKLASFPQQWPFPRGDLYHWIPLLDRFDHILELFNQEYGLKDGPQVQPLARRLLTRGDGQVEQPWPNTGAALQELNTAGFSAEGDRELIEAILHFTQILLEHCGNRSLYASSAHLNHLLNAASLSLLKACLKLSLRLAQRYQAARFKNSLPHAQSVLLANHYAFNIDNLHKLAMPFPKPAVIPANVTLSTPSKSKPRPSQSLAFIPSDLVRIAKDPESLTSVPDIAAVNFIYYKPTSTTSTVTSPVPLATSSPVTPTPIRRTSNLGPSARSRPSPGDRSVSTNDALSRTRDADAIAMDASNRPRNLHLSTAQISNNPTWKLTQEHISAVPEEFRYELLNRIRIAKALSEPSSSAPLLLEIRLLAIANLFYALNESKIQERIGNADGEEPRRFSLAQQLCDLLQPAAEGQLQLSVALETTVLMTIEALCKSRHKIAEIAESLSISVNHGVLYYELRKVIASLSAEAHQDIQTELRGCEWRDATFDLINSLQQANVQARYGERMVTAGIMDIMVEVLVLKTIRAERLQEKVLQFFTSFIHNVPTAFQTLAAHRGLDVISDLAQYHVQAAMDSALNGRGLPASQRSRVIDYKIPFYTQATLRQLFKFIVNMFEHNAGTHDRLLRNLIDTPQILTSLKTVIENADIFGSNVWSGAVNIVSSFIHNEPTSYQVIGEAGLSRSLLEAVIGASIPLESSEEASLNPADLPTEVSFVNGEPVAPSITGILPVGETMCDVPTAFGAICLNETGMQAFQASKALVKFFDIFVSPAHVRALEEEPQTAGSIGQAFDELSRHHPRLKDQIVDAVLSMVKRVDSLCRGFALHKNIGGKLWFKRPSDGQWCMHRANGTSSGYKTPSNEASDGDQDSGLDLVPVTETEIQPRENVMALPYVSACFRFLEGFFQNSSMISAFCSKGGIECVLDLATSPSNPFDLVAFQVFEKIANTIKAMSDSKPHLVLPSVLSRTQKALAVLKPLAESGRSEGVFAEYMTVASRPQNEHILNGPNILTAFAHTHLFAELLSRIFAQPNYASRHANQTNQLFVTLNFTDVHLDLVSELSRLHASSVWENLVLQQHLTPTAKEWSDPKPFITRRVGSDGYAETAGEPSSLVPSGSKHMMTDETMIAKNAKAVRFLYSRVLPSIEGFFRALGQALLPKRSSDISVRQQTTLVADRLAKCIIAELRFRKYANVDETMEYRYAVAILDAVSHILLRPSFSMETYNHREAVTVVLQKFYLQDGFEVLHNLAMTFSDAFKTKSENLTESTTETAAKDGMRTILDFFNHVARSKCISEAIQSYPMSFTNPKHAEYFVAGQFVVELRDAILPTVSKLWWSSSMDHMGSHHAKQVIENLRVIMRGEGEDRALERSDNASRRIATSKYDFSLRNITLVQTLESRGIPHSLAREALYRCNNNEAMADEYAQMTMLLGNVLSFPIPADSEGGNATFQDSINGPSVPENAQSSEALLSTPNAANPTNNVVTHDADDMSEDDPQALPDLPVDVDEQDLLSMVDGGTGRLQDILNLASGISSRRTLAAPMQDTQQLYTTLDDLEDKREAIRQTLIERCLEVLSASPIVTFDLADLIQAAVALSGEGANPRAEIGSTLVSSLLSLQGEEQNREAGLKISAYAHLVALILQDRDFFDSTLDELKECFDVLVGWVRLEPGQRPDDAPWMEMILLIIERVLAEDEQPPSLDWTPPPADDPLRPLTTSELPPGVVSSQVRVELTDALLDSLPKIGKNGSLALSISRVLVILSRKYEIASRLREKSAMSRLFLMIRQLSGSIDDKLHSSVMLILRHLAEDEEIIRQIMRTDIKAACEGHRSSRALDTATYTRNLYHLVLRAPDLFVEVTQELMEITRFDGNPTRAQHLALKKTPVPSTLDTAPAVDSKAKPSIETEALAAQKVSDSRPAMSESTDGVVSYLLRELSNFKDVEEPFTALKSSQVSDTPSTDDNKANSGATDAIMPDAEGVTTDIDNVSAGQSEGAKPNRVHFKSDEHPIFVYRCFILQCLSELLASYTRMKVEFINFSRKPETVQGTPSKPRVGTLNYLLHVLIPLGTLEHPDDVVYRKRQATSYWAQMAIIALCAKTQEKASKASSSVEDEPELTFVRKFVIEQAIRAFKEATYSFDSLDSRYSRLLGLGELFNRLLNGKVDRSHTLTSNDDNYAPDIGKIMYDKSMIGVLTSAVAEIDLNFPNAKRAVKYILGPLKKLTMLGVNSEALRSVSSSSDVASQEDADEVSSATSMSDPDDEDDDEDDREHTPDLLRNTTLGMLESGADEEESDSGSEDEDEDMYDEFEEEMEYEEEQLAEHGDVVSDEDEEIDGIGHIEGLPGDVDMDVEIVMDDEDVDSDEDDEDETSEDEDEEDEDDIGMAEFGEMMNEITGANDTASEDDDDGGDWEDQAEEDAAQGEVGFDHDHDLEEDLSEHRDALDHIAHVIGADEHSDPGDAENVVRINMGGGEEEYFEDEMAPDDEDEDEEGEYVNDIVYEPEAEEEDDGNDMAWNWNAPPPPAMIHRHHHHGSAGLPRAFNEMFGMIGGDFFRPPHFRTPRNASNARGEDDGMNPLLQRNNQVTGRNQTRENEAENMLARIARQVHATPNFGRPPSESFIQNLVAAVAPGSGGQGGTINVSLDGMRALPPVLSIHSRPGGPAVIDINPTRPWRDQLSMPFWNGRTDGRTGTGTEESQAVQFTPVTTGARWQEEARMLFSGKHHEKATRVLNALMRCLVPAAMEAKREADKVEAQREAERARAREEERQKAEAERQARKAREKQEKEEQQAREAEEAARRVEEERSSQTQEVHMQGVERTEEQSANDTNTSAEPQMSTHERITTTIRGREIDVTALGIDREYLDALPEDMREEVIMQQFQEQRSQAVQSGEQITEISREFLEALPRNIQAELLRQEAADRRRREREEARRAAQQAGSSHQAQPEEMNNADLFAMLDPQLRQTILMDADENTLASLPEELQAEARALIGERGQRTGMLSRRPHREERVVDPPQPFDSTSEEKRNRRPVPQMLDKAGIATLLRLLFVTLPPKAKTNLHSILSHACKNTQNRSEVISILLSILQDGTADVTAVEKTFAQLSLKAKQNVLKTPQSLKRMPMMSQPLSTGAELSPLNIVHQCLALLNDLAHDNPRVPSFFLNEHETSAAQKLKAAKKGKLRESRAVRYPLNALLTLLDRNLITDNSSVMEVLASLLSRITQPLTILLRRAREGQEHEAANSQVTSEPNQRPGTSSDISMGDAANAANVSGESSTAENAETSTVIDPANTDKKPHKALSPPEVPEENIRLVVNILSARECPSKTFSDTLDIIKNLSAVPGAKEAFGRELVKRAKELADAIVADLETLAGQIQDAQSGTQLQGLALANFSSPGSKQRKILRVLLSFDHLFDPKRAAQHSQSGASTDTKTLSDVLLLQHDNNAFDVMWAKLHDCLKAIGDRSNMINVATILLPLIEAFMVICRATKAKVPDDAAEGRPSTPQWPMEAIFYEFTNENRKILNELIRNNPKLLSGHLSILAKNSKVLEFDNKRVYFNRKLHHRGEGRMAHPTLQLNVRRDQVFLDSFKSLYYKSGNEIKYGKLNIRFSGEEGIDAGGVSREWFAVMARQMFNPGYALFNPVASDRTTFHPNPLSNVNDEHLMFFKFIGRIIGKALYEGRVLDCYFSRAVYRRILGKSVSLKDMESLDLEYYKSLVWILENDITDVTFETFSEEISRFGDVETIDLIENGRNIPVTEENKAEYVRLVVEHRLVKSVEEQLKNFLDGFHEIIPPELIAIFNEQELELLISGLPEIDVEDWKNNTEYHNYQATSAQIQWFWRAVRSFDKEEKAKLLQFVTGTSKVPLNGFKELEGMNGFAKFNIHRDYSSKEKLPSSHTCFNQLDLPEYDTYEHLRQQLYTAITAGSEYFGFA